jgi:hypothetical protein
MIAALELDAVLADWQVPLPQSRLFVYRNNVRAALAGALAVRFPAVAALLGTAAFRSLALSYCARKRPTSPVLIHYGGEFPAHVAGLEPGLGGVALIDDAWWRAYHAADDQALGATGLEALTAEQIATLRFRFHPSFSLVQVEPDTLALWQKGRGSEAIPLPGGSGAVLVIRTGAEVLVRAITEESFHFLDGLQRGASLGTAAAATLASFPGFDLASQITGLFTLGLITEIAHD